MKIRLFIAFLVLSFLTASYAQTAHPETEIAWDSWGVPHIT